MIFIDDREDGKIFNILNKLKIQYEKKRLEVGDIVCGNVCVERKEISDFIHSMQSGRLQNQLLNMEANYKNNFLIIVGEFKNLFFQHINININQYIGMCASVLARYNIKTWFVQNNTQYIKLVLKIIEKLGDEKVIVVKKIHYQTSDIKTEFLRCFGLNKKQINGFLEKYNPLDILTIDLEKLSEIKGFGNVTIINIRTHINSLKNI